MYNLKFGCQSYPWKMGKHFGQLPRMLKVAAEAGFQSIECEIDMLGTWFHDPEGVKKITWNLRLLFFIRIGMAWRRLRKKQR